MRAPLPFHCLRPLLGAAALLLPAASVHAEDECTTDADCETGFECEAIGATGCADVACPDGTDCPEPEPCEEETILGCVPAACRSDADCGAGFVCLTVGYSICTGTAEVDCPPGTDCSDATPPARDGDECEEVEERFCAPPYAAPCEVAADCGDGFECIPAETCRCTGGAGVDGGAPTPAGGADDADGGASGDTPADDASDEPACECSPTGENYCRPLEVTCVSDGDCVEGWSCVDGASTSVPCSFDPETGVEDCPEPTDPERYCAPPYWDSGWGRGSSGGYEALAAATGDEDAAPRAPGPPAVHGSDGCAVAARGGRPLGGPGILTMGLLGLLLARRRRRGR